MSDCTCQPRTATQKALGVRGDNDLQPTTRDELLGVMSGPLSSAFAVALDNLVRGAMERSAAAERARIAAEVVPTLREIIGYLDASTDATPFEHSDHMYANDLRRVVSRLEDADA